MDKNFNKKLTFFLCAWFNDPRWKGFVGATVKIRDLAENLFNLRHRVVLFVPDCGIDESKFPFKVITIPVVNIPILRVISFNLRLFLKMIRMKPRPDIIYMRRSMTFVPAVASLILGLPFFFEVNDDPYRRDARSSGAYIRYIFSLFLDHFNILIARRIFIISEHIANNIYRHFPFISKKKIVITESGTNTVLFYPMDKKHAASTTGLDSDNLYLTFVGTLLPHQGIDTLLESAHLIIDAFPESRFLIIGEGPMKIVWQRMALTKNLKRFFIFTGQIPYEQVPAWIGVSDICLAPYRKDAGLRSPVKIYDYMACARPVVASDITGCTDKFKDTGGVILVPPEEPKALARVVIELLSDPLKREKMGRMARKWVEKNASRKMIARRVAREAKEVL